MHWGGDVVLGQTGGTETVPLNSTQIPSHNHNLSGTSTPGDRIEPNSTLANIANSYNHYGPASAGTLVALAPGAIAPVGSSQGHSNIQPCLTVNFSIALSGIFPTRN